MLVSEISMLNARQGCTRRSFPFCIIWLKTRATLSCRTWLTAPSLSVWPDKREWGTSRQHFSGEERTVHVTEKLRAMEGSAKYVSVPDMCAGSTEKKVIFMSMNCIWWGRVGGWDLSYSVKRWTGADGKRIEEESHRTLADLFIKSVILLFVLLATKNVQLECGALSPHEMMVRCVKTGKSWRDLCRRPRNVRLITTIFARLDSANRECSEYLRQQSLAPEGLSRTALYFFRQDDKSPKSFTKLGFSFCLVLR